MLSGNVIVKMWKEQKSGTRGDTRQPRSQGLFPGLGAPRPQAREKTLGTRLDSRVCH